MISLTSIGAIPSLGAPSLPEHRTDDRVQDSSVTDNDALAQASFLPALANALTVPAQQQPVVQGSQSGQEEQMCEGEPNMPVSTPTLVERPAACSGVTQDAQPEALFPTQAGSRSLFIPVTEESGSLQSLSASSAENGIQQNQSQTAEIKSVPTPVLPTTPDTEGRASSAFSNTEARSSGPVPISNEALQPLQSTNELLDALARPMRSSLTTDPETGRFVIARGTGNAAGIDAGKQNAPISNVSESAKAAEQAPSRSSQILSDQSAIPADEVLSVRYTNGQMRPAVDRDIFIPWQSTVPPSTILGNGERAILYQRAKDMANPSDRKYDVEPSIVSSANVSKSSVRDAEGGDALQRPPMTDRDQAAPPATVRTKDAPTLAAAAMKSTAQSDVSLKITGSPDLEVSEPGKQPALAPAGKIVGVGGDEAKSNGFGETAIGSSQGASGKQETEPVVSASKFGIRDGEVRDALQRLPMIDRGQTALAATTRANDVPTSTAPATKPTVESDVRKFSVRDAEVKDAQKNNGRVETAIGNSQDASGEQETGLAIPSSKFSIRDAEVGDAFQRPQMTGRGQAASPSTTHANDAPRSASAAAMSASGEPNVRLKNTTDQGLEGSEPSRQPALTLAGLVGKTADSKSDQTKNKERGATAAGNSQGVSDEQKAVPAIPNADAPENIHKTTESLNGQSALTRGYSQSGGQLSGFSASAGGTADGFESLKSGFDTHAISTLVAENLMNRISGDVVQKLRDGVSELKLQLKPESLGTIHLKVRVDDGEITAQINATRPEVRAALESNIPQLRDALSSRGIEVQRIDIFTTGDSPAREFRGQQELKQKASTKRRESDGPEERYKGTRLMGYNTVEIIM